VYVENALSVVDGPDADRWLADLATRQHGVVAWFQIDAAGIPRRRLDTWIALGRVFRVHRGVYAVGHRALSPQGRLMAAVLALGPAAALSHRSAAFHWGLLLRPPSTVHVTVPSRGTRRRRRGIVVHRAPGIRSEVHDAIPVTTVAQTLLDLAATSRRTTLDHAIERAETLRLFDLDALAPLLAARGAGVRALRDAVAAYDDAPTRSELERLFLQICRDHGIPRPLVNTRIGDLEVDFLWPEHRLVVETDGREWHGTRAGREDDTVRDAALALAGFWTQRFDWRIVTRRRAYVAEVVLHLLAERRP
jgi:very-short-patch-repair endonuclease